MLFYVPNIVVYLYKGMIARNTYTVLHHSLHIDLFFSRNFFILTQNDSKFLDKVLMTIIHLA